MYQWTLIFTVIALVNVFCIILIYNFTTVTIIGGQLIGQTLFMSIGVQLHVNRLFFHARTALVVESIN